MTYRLTDRAERARSWRIPDHVANPRMPNIVGFMVERISRMHWRVFDLFRYLEVETPVLKLQMLGPPEHDSGFTFWQWQRYAAERFGFSQFAMGLRSELDDWYFGKYKGQGDGGTAGGDRPAKGMAEGQGSRLSAQVRVGS